MVVGVAGAASAVVVAVSEGVAAGEVALAMEAAYNMASQ